MFDIIPAVHIHDNDLQLYVRGRLASERISAVDSHLLECETCRERLSQYIGLRLTLPVKGKLKSEENDKRSEPRFATGDDAIVQELHPLSLDRQKVRIADISNNGLSILAPKSLLPGTIVQIRMERTVGLGKVQNCSARKDEGYRIGLRLQDEF